MDHIYPFVKSSNIIDIISIVLVFLTSFSLIVAGIALLIWAKRRKWLYVFVVLSLLPLIIALADATYRIGRAETLLAKFPEISSSEVEELRAEFRVESLTMTGIGVAGTALPFALGIGGLIFKKNSDAK